MLLFSTWNGSVWDDAHFGWDTEMDYGICCYYSPQLNTSKMVLDEIENDWGTDEDWGKLYKNIPKGAQIEYKQLSIIELPKEFQPLYSASKESVIANLVKNYLYERGINDNDFIKYGIGYCNTGDYGGRVVIPSYSESGTLNFFVARSFDGNYFKYKNPEASKDIIFFENLISFSILNFTIRLLFLKNEIF